MIMIMLQSLIILNCKELIESCIMSLQPIALGSYLVIDLNVTDVDGDKLEYKLVGGADKSRFLELNMSASSVLAFGSSDPTFPSYGNAMI